MIKLIDELKVIPGIIGACIVTAEGVQATNLPAIFKPERLAMVGRHLLTLNSAGRENFGDLTDMTLNYDESVVVARELVAGTILFAICDPTFNYNLLAMSFNLLQEEFKKGDFVSAEPAAETKSAESTSPVEASAKAPEDEGISAPLQELLDEMKERLAKVLGPMAGFVFDDVFEAWQEQGATSFSRINDLVAGIDREIEDQEKIDHYRTLIAPSLKAYRAE